MRRWVAYGACALALLAIGYALGRYAQPAKIVTKEHETVKTVTQVQYKDRVVVETTVRYVRAKATHQVIVEVKAPDGTQTKTTTTDTATSTKAADTTPKAESSTATEAARTEEARDYSKEVLASKPQWQIGAFVGLQLHQGPAYGVQAARRLLGPFWVTASIDTGERVNLGAEIEL